MQTCLFASQQHDKKLHSCVVIPQLYSVGSLFKACVDGDFAYTELLINNGMSPNTCDYNQRTPLHLAASNGHTHIVHFLCNQPVCLQSLLLVLG